MSALVFPAWWERCSRFLLVTPMPGRLRRLVLTVWVDGVTRYLVRTGAIRQLR